MKSLIVHRDATTTFANNSYVTFPIDAHAIADYHDLLLACNDHVEIFAQWPQSDLVGQANVISLNDFRRPTLIGIFKPASLNHFPKEALPYSVTGLVCYPSAGIVNDALIVSMELRPFYRFVDKRDVSLGTKIDRFGMILASTTYSG